jgi:hypothetical protein
MDSIFRNVVLKDYPGTIILGYHTTSMLVPPFNVYQGDSVYGLYPQIGDRAAFPNGLGIGFDYPDIANEVENLYNLTTPVVIEVSSKAWNPDTRIVDLSLSITNDGPDLPGSYWYNVVVTEDSILEPRAVLDGCGTPSPGTHYVDLNYLNHWVARKLVFWSQGTSLIGSSWSGQQSINRSCTFSLDSAWIPENCNVTIHVYQKQDSLYKSPTMQAIQVPVVGWTGTQESKLKKIAIMGVFPNPAMGIANVHISLEKRGKYTLYLCDLNGQLIKPLLQGNRAPGLYNVEIQTHSIPAGTYLVVLETPSGKTSEKLVIR